MSPTCQNLIGSGVVVHVPSFFKELADLEEQGLENVRERIFISVSKSESTGSKVMMLTQS
jgi:adenylosuccinate synthase